MAGNNLLEVISELQNKGMNDAQIVAQLKNLGCTQQEISDAMSQAAAKAAISGNEETKAGDMQPSILQQRGPEKEELFIPKPIAKKTRKAGKTAEYSPTTEVAETTAYYPYAYQEQAAPAYPSSETAASTGSLGDVETIEEIAEEIVSEKFSEIRNKLTEVLDFKEIIETKIVSLDDRLKRIESNIDRLQEAFLTKVQEYGKDVKSIGTGMLALEGAFSKILNPLIDNVKQLDKITGDMKEKVKKSR